jgi:macrodomain Ter protein organizer (MatP/YcbG family)
MDPQRSLKQSAGNHGASDQTASDLSIPGLGIYLRNAEGAWPLILRSATRREDWKVYRSLAVHESARGGTTLLYQDRAYRIDEEEEGDGAWIYRLKKWPEGEVWHRVVRLTAEDLAREASEKKAFARARKLEEISVYYEFLFGFLPVRTQIRIARHLRFSPEHASRKNALLEFLVSLTLSILMMLISWQSPSGFGAALLFWLLTVEGFVRYGHVLAKQGPCGLFLLEIVERFYLLIRRKK